MTRPWTAIATDRSTGKRATIIFDGAFDGTHAVKDFKEKFKSMQLEALVPGEHSHTLVQNEEDKRSRTPNDKLFSGF